MATYNVTVTADDITYGSPDSARNNPLARALRRAVTGRDLRVARGRVYEGRDLSAAPIATFASAEQTFMDDYRGDNVASAADRAQFSIDIPDPA